MLGEDYPLVLAKEITKTFETFFSGTATELLEWLKADEVHQKGEMVLMFGSVEKQDNGLPDDAVELLKQLKAELPLKKAAAVVAAHYGLKKNDLYKFGLTLD